MESFQESNDGTLYTANGFGPMLRWDGLDPEMEEVGVKAPTQKVTMQASGHGQIVGDYKAYLRFVDSKGNKSNLSPISDTLSASHHGGNINAVDATLNTTPIFIRTQTQHFLNDGDTVKISGVVGAEVANGIWTVTINTAYTFSLNGSFGDGTSAGDVAVSVAESGGIPSDPPYPISGTWALGASTILYTTVQTPTEAKVVKRQILRNTDGEADTYYVDVETTDLTSSTFSSTRTDNDLATQEAQALLDDQGAILANANTPPPQNKAVLASVLGRLFAAVEVIYSEGSVVVTFGSKTVTGIGTEWTSAVKDRFLSIIGGDKDYQIDSIDVPSQTLTLLEGYLGATDAYASYGIASAKPEFKNVDYSEAQKPESWPATNALTVPADSDRITGLMVMGSFLYVVEERHIYRFTFQSNPAIDGNIFLAANRGCVNNRCWTIVDGTAYMLDGRGVHVFDGGNVSKPISLPIQELFDPNAKSKWRINWKASAYFHASYFAQQQVVKFFVALAGHYLPRHAIVWDIQQENWWIEEYNVPIGANTLAQINGQPAILLGSEARKVLYAEIGNLDGPNPDLGPVRGTVTAADVCSISDSTAVFAASGLVGSPVVITDGRGKGQARVIYDVTGTKIRVTLPWLVQPDTTSTYQIGGIQWRFRAGLFRFALDENQNPRRIVVQFGPVIAPATMDMRLYWNRLKTPVVWQVNRESVDGNGVRSRIGDADLVCDLTKPIGIVQQRFDYSKDIYADGIRFVQPELAGVTNEEPVAIFEVDIDGVNQ